MYNKEMMAAYGCSDLARGNGADLCETILEEIQVALVTLWALVDNLIGPSELVANYGVCERRAAYHDFDLAVGPGHLETRTTLGGIVPNGTRIRRAVQPRWDTGHGGEGARTPVEVSPIEGGRAGYGCSAQGIGRATG